MCDLARRHPRIYRRPKPGPTDYRPVVAVIAIVVFRLALIAFIFTLRTGT